MLALVCFGPWGQKKVACKRPNPSLHLAVGYALVLLFIWYDAFCILIWLVLHRFLDNSCGNLLQTSAKCVNFLMC